MSATIPPVLNTEILNAFAGKFAGDPGAATHASMVVIGEKLGLYKALADYPMTSAELAARTHTRERYVREWLAAQAKDGFVSYDSKTMKFSLSKEQVNILAQENSPTYLPRALEVALGPVSAVPGIVESFRRSSGMNWLEPGERVFQ